MIRIRRGTSLVSKVLKQFDQAVADLAVAAEQIEAKRQKTVDKMTKQTEKHQAKLAELRAKNNATLGKLNSEEYELYLAGRRAETVRQNIAKLVGAE